MGGRWRCAVLGWLRCSLPPAAAAPRRFAKNATAARTARSAGHAVATAVHLRVQQCLCAVSPPPTPQAGLLAAPSHRERSRGPQTLRTNSCLCECRPLKEHMEVQLLLLLQRQQHDAADVSLRISVLLQPCCCSCSCSCSCSCRSAECAVARLEVPSLNAAHCTGGMLDIILAHHHAIISASTDGCGSLGWPGDAGGR